MLKKPNGSKLTILMVEDSKADALLIEKQIASIAPSAKVIIAPSLLEAYTISLTEDINLILLDLNLPESFGPMTVKEAKLFSKHIPIIAITGMDKDSVAEEAQEFGVKAFIQKSDIESDVFKNIIRQYLPKQYSF